MSIRSEGTSPQPEGTGARSDGATTPWRRGFTGRFFPWLEDHVGLWMSVVWIPVFLLAPALDIVARIRDGTPAWSNAIATVMFVGMGVTFVIAVMRGLRRRYDLGAAAALVLLAGFACAAMGAYGWVTPFALPAIALGVVVPYREVLPTLLVMTGFAGVLVGFVDGAIVAGLAAASLVFLAGLGNFVIHRLVAANVELAAAREQLARAAVEEERARFARDLHDLLGHTLSVIVVKGEAVRRLVHTDPDAAAQHAADIERIGRTALAEVREAVSGARRAGLTTELARARNALESAGIDVNINNTAGTLPSRIEEVVGWVVREGATNVVRHASAAHCSITIRRTEDIVVAEVLDAGTTDTPGHPLTEGSGLVGLRERVAAVGGELIPERTSDGFRLVARIPIDTTTTKENRA